jgi:pyruvate/2-oxoglutarate dehydrogenase complex dihydrolipoamide acyltransferase (E2) component
MPNEVITRFPSERIHTYYFLQFARRFSPVYLSTEVDMSEIVESRQSLAHEYGRRISYISFIVEQAARTLAAFPQANAAVRHGLFPKVAYFKEVHAKFTIDKRINRTRAVVPGVIEHADKASLEEIQDRIEYYRDRAFEDLPELNGIRKLQALPRLFAQRVFNALVSNLSRRGRVQGTFSITSLGHAPIHAFFPVITSTICFGVGRVEPRPAVVNGKLVIRPTMTLSMAFDHAAIDGGTAADLLSDVKNRLENYKAIPVGEFAEATPEKGYQTI